MARKNSDKFNVRISRDLDDVIEKYTMIYTPQANKIDKICTAIEVMKHSFINEKDLSSGFSMSARQAEYYSDALRFLGLVDTMSYNGQTLIGLTPQAQEYFGTTRNVETTLAKWILENDLIVKNKEALDRNISGLNEVTRKRRQQSYEAWKKFIEGETWKK